MKYLIIITIAFVIYNKFDSRVQANENLQLKIHKNLKNQNESQSLLYSGTLYKIRNKDYDRFIFVKKTSEDYLLRMIKEYGELSGTKEFKEHSFWVAKSGDWYIIKVGKLTNFYTYHNLVCWFNGYEENPDIPEYSIGFSKNKFNSQQDYFFHLDPNIKLGDTEIGAFRNGKSFFIYLPEAYDEFGNLKITSDIKISVNEIIKFISNNGLDISIIESVEFVEHIIKMKE